MECALHCHPGHMLPCAVSLEVITIRPHKGHNMYCQYCLCRRLPGTCVCTQWVNKVLSNKVPKVAAVLMDVFKEIFSLFICMVFLLFHCAITSFKEMNLISQTQNTLHYLHLRALVGFNAHWSQLTWHGTAVSPFNSGRNTKIGLCLFSMMVEIYYQKQGCQPAKFDPLKKNTWHIL